MINTSITIIQVVILLMITCFCTEAQHRYDDNWLMGYEPTFSLPPTQGIRFNFYSDSLQIHEESWVLEMDLTNASMSDAQGNLIFSSNGCDIADRSGEIMQGGDGINPGDDHDTFCRPEDVNAYLAGPQALLSLPDPSNDYRYYLFHTATKLIREPLEVLTNVLYYSLIDMRENNSLGAVIEKNEIVIMDSLAYGQLTAVKHQNDRDWWIITPRKNGKNEFFRFLLTEDGIGPILEQEIGVKAHYSGNSQSKFSPDGTKYIRYNPFDDLLIFDFDRETGLLSNFELIGVEDEAGITGGCAISPNSRFAYICSRNEILQFDLLAIEIAASEVRVAVYDSFFSPFPTTFLSAQLAPDCKIYLNSTNAVDVMHVIHQPNLKGLDCQVEQHGIELPSYNGFTMPYFPNYRLGTPYDNKCDTLLISATSTSYLPKSDVDIYPNPMKNILNINSHSGFNNTILNLYDVHGRIAISHKLVTSQNLYQIDVSHLSAGLYYYTFYSPEGMIKQGSLVKVE